MEVARTRLARYDEVFNLEDGSDPGKSTGLFYFSPINRVDQLHLKIIFRYETSYTTGLTAPSNAATPMTHPEDYEAPAISTGEN